MHKRIDLPKFFNLNVGTAKVGKSDDPKERTDVQSYAAQLDTMVLYR